MPKVLLVGNPNCGKTTIFNLLTASSARIGNWPGVTVEKKHGDCQLSTSSIEVIDLPGVYSLSVDKNSAQDSQITAAEVASCDADILINVIDASHLERHLYLTTQLLELHKPVIVVLNMTDIAKNRRIDINSELLSKKLGCPVISMQANKRRGLHELKQYIESSPHTPSNFKIHYQDALEQIIDTETKSLATNTKISKAHARYLISRQLECNEQNNIQKHSVIQEDFDILMADARYSAINKLVNIVQARTTSLRETLTAKIDKIVLNRFLALPIFIGIMYIMFLLAINVGSVFQGFFDATTDVIFINSSAYWLTKLGAPAWLITLVSHGIGRGINTTATFIPVIAMMYFLLALLESSGYMARAAFVIDRVMRFLGLPGKSFVPMIVGFGCNVPGIMAARTLESERDRILTVLMSPFMSCSARLAIYAVFVSAFFPIGGQNIVFSLYMIGILMAVFTGFILKKTVLAGTTSPLIIELPAYHVPTFKFLIKETFTRLRYFLIRAGKLIIPICVLLSGLGACTVVTASGETSLIALFGKWMSPVFVPMGISADNWPAVVGLLTGTLAKEVVVGTLNSLYSHMAQASNMVFVYELNFLHDLKQAGILLYYNLMSLGSALSNPIGSSVNNVELSDTAFGMMSKSFQTNIAAYAYLLFVLLYIPCVSTMAAIRQETSRKLMLFSIVWSIALAYITATAYYQIASRLVRPEYQGYQTLIWLGLTIIVLTLIMFRMISIMRRRNVTAAA